VEPHCTVMLSFVPSAWVNRADSPDLVAVGRDRDGARVTATIGPCPVHFYIRVPPPVHAALGADLAERVRWAATNRLKARAATFDATSLSCALRRARSLYGHQPHDGLFVSITAPTLAALRDVARALATWGAVDRRFLHLPTELFETDVPALTRFLHALDSAPHHPLRLRPTSDSAHPTLGRLVAAHPTHVARVPDDERWPCELRVAAFDIEVMSDDRVSFPDAARAGDFVAQIGVVERWRGAESRTLFVCQPTAPVDDAVDLRRSDDEPSMLAAFVAWLCARDIDCLAGYNTFGFDWAYILARLERAGRDVATLAPPASPAWRTPAVATQKLASAAFGCNEYTYLAIPGIVPLDLLVFLRRELKLESFKLDDVAFELTGQRKLDMPPRTIFASLAADDRPVDAASAARANVGRYCLVDCALVLDIIDSRDVALNLLETANVTGVAFGDILLRGMQIRSYTQILRVGNAMGFLLPRIPRVEAERYEGATVLHAEPGLFYEGVGVLDFLSLYPSIMIAWNVCYSTLLRDDQLDVPHHTVHDEHGAPVARFASDADGVLPTLLRQLWDGRKLTKRQMATEQDPLRKKLLNAKQLAQKVGMNSIYGMTGSGTGMLPCLPIAAAITTQGRAMLAASRDFVEANFPCRVVYGDSVTADTPIAVHTAAGRAVMPVADLYALVAATPADPPPRLRVATHLGLRDVLSVVQHATTKPVFRVTLASGASVDVTEDHSLVADDGSLLRPADIVVGSTRVMVLPSAVCPAR